MSDTVNSNEESSENVKALDLFSSYYNNYWWIGLVKKKNSLEKNEQQEDFHIKFMHPMFQVHHLCSLLSRIFVEYQTTIFCVKLIALLQKLAEINVVSEADIIFTIS